MVCVWERESEKEKEIDRSILQTQWVGELGYPGTRMLVLARATWVEERGDGVGHRHRWWFQCLLWPLLCWDLHAWLPMKHSDRSWVFHGRPLSSTKRARWQQTDKLGSCVLRESYSDRWTLLFLNSLLTWSAISGAFLSRRASFWLTRIPHVMI